MKSVFKQPLTWVAIALLVGVEIAFHAWFGPTLVMSLVALGAGVVAFFLWVGMARSAGRTAAAEAAAHRASTELQDRIDALEEDLRSVNFPQGRQQLRQLQKKIGALTDVLGRRMNAGEITYGRYMGVAEQVFLSALDNLHEAAIALRSINTIDHYTVSHRMSQLKRLKDPTSEEQQELEALTSRAAIHAEQTARVADLVTKNEAAMTVLDSTTAALAGTKTQRGYAKMDPEVAMSELEQLVQRAHEYAHSR